MSEFLAAYGLFLAELATFALVLVVIVVAILVVASRRRGHAEGLVVDHLNRQFENSADDLKLAIEGKASHKKALKARQKERKREEKARRKDGDTKPRLFVLDFKGDLRASAVASLREEVSAVLRVAKPGEQVLVRLENSGGTVHEHGFAASQLTRLKQHGLKLVVAVDKVAASNALRSTSIRSRPVSTGTASARWNSSSSTRSRRVTTSFSKWPRITISITSPTNGDAACRSACSAAPRAY